MKRRKSKRLLLVCGLTIGFLLAEFIWLEELFARPSLRRKGLNSSLTRERNEPSPVSKIYEDFGIETGYLQGLVDLKKSKIVIQDKKSVYRVGDEVKIRIILYDKDGKRRKKGGDAIKVRIFEDRLNASAVGHVTDHGTGSYTATLSCLWVGYPTIQVYLYYTREMPGMIEGILDSVPTLRYTLAVYNNNNSSSSNKGRCHPFRHLLFGTRPICNLTELNGGMSWYCEKPEKGDYSCSDVQYFKPDTLVQYLALQEFYNISARGPFEQTIKTRVIPPYQGRRICQGDCPKNYANWERFASKPECNQFNRTQLWNLKSPTGFFYQDKWFMLHCKQPSLTDLKTVLKHRRLVLYGDSTVRQWFREMKNRFRCAFVVERWNTTMINLDERIYCPYLNLTIDHMYHALPGNLNKSRTRFYSISQHLLTQIHQKDALFLIFLQNHFQVYHFDVFIDRITQIRKSVDKLLKVNPNATIFLKSSHASWYAFDYRIEAFRNIVMETFKDLRDEVIYLDNRDFAIAKVTTNSHPKSVVVRAMVDQLLAYIPL